ncbi:uncharacterized protein BXZ73DRAFT_37599 [Epithele typhae]|uniref:uncharacterized protein n=1 Tax=Epithele typhae TaxID=378194 RepID=UPI0020082A4C|nr:uncharacterized protein BXZ73DRAFT_37599 [Epithele typhae]KAH9946115.1 hypothetical protein BXZ73DRAFT_37599 [Epithele typhae]
MPPRPSHKRTATATSDTSPAPPEGAARKRTRFVEPVDDPANFAEEVDAALEDPSARRKGRVNTSGYDSDSSDDGEGVVNSRKPGAKPGDDDDDDDDMFAVGKEEEKPAAEGGKKKKEEFLRLGDIEGQEFGRRADGEDGEDEDEEEEEDEPEDEDDAERRKKAGMGFELSAFNMREEMEEGKFSADGMYVRSFDPHAVHDRWMDDVDEDEMKKARKHHKAQEKIQKEKQRAEERELEALGGKESVEMKLVAKLKKGETVLEALQRLGAQSKKNGAAKKKPNNKMKRDVQNVTMDVDQPSKPSQTDTDVEEITHLASTLMSLGDTDIYTKTYEELVRSIRKAGTVGEDWIPPSADVKYEYKWAMPGAGEEDKLFGPFAEEEMNAWYSAAYFGAAGEKVKVRKVGGEWGNWDEVIL